MKLCGVGCLRRSCRIAIVLADRKKYCPSRLNHNRILQIEIELGLGLKGLLCCFQSLAVLRPL